MGDSTPVQSSLRLNREVAGKEWAAGPFSSQGRPRSHSPPLSGLQILVVRSRIWATACRC